MEAKSFTHHQNVWQWWTPVFPLKVQRKSEEEGKEDRELTDSLMFNANLPLATLCALTLFLMAIMRN